MVMGMQMYENLWEKDEVKCYCIIEHILKYFAVFEPPQNILQYLSHHMGKPTICLDENKGADQLCSYADQLRSNCEADQLFCFRYSDSTVPLLLKSEISSF